MSAIMSCTRARSGESGNDFLQRVRPYIDEAARLGIPGAFPGYIRMSLAAYLSFFQRPDAFLQRVLENDLFAALDEATTLEASILPDLARWIRDNAPLQSTGSKADVRAWLECDE